jgi:hypothetical protein
MSDHEGSDFEAFIKKIGICAAFILKVGYH